MWAVLVTAVASVVIALVAVTGKNAGDGKAGSRQYDLGSGQMFDAIAPRYDLINKVISLGLDMRWRQTMIDGLQLKAGDRVVDMATGTADVAIMLAQELAKLDAATSPQQPVIGIDPSANMLDVGRTKVEEAGLSSLVQLRIGDAQDLADVPNGSVDKLTMAFGIRNVPDRVKALHEFRRIMATAEGSSRSDASVAEELAGESSGEGKQGERDTRGGSVLAILELQNPETGFLAFASRGFVKYAAPILGWVMSGSGAEYGHLTNSIMAFPSVQEWTDIMAEAGLEVFSHKTMGFGAVHLYLSRPRVVT